MKKEQIEILKKSLEIELSKEQSELFDKYEKCFLKKNALTNLISKNDEKLLFEKHIFDSLALHKFLKRLSHNKPEKLLDIGTGGGFPAIPLAILYPEISVYAIDSIRKKIKIIEEIKEELGLKNLFPLCERVENLQRQSRPIIFDYITTRAVAPLKLVLQYAMVNLKTGGYFIAYKSKKAADEIKDAEKILKQSDGEVVEIVEYTLPLQEVYDRNLIIVRKK